MDLVVEGPANWLPNRLPIAKSAPSLFAVNGRPLPVVPGGEVLVCSCFCFFFYTTALVYFDLFIYTKPDALKSLQHTRVVAATVVVGCCRLLAICCLPPCYIKSWSRGGLKVVKISKSVHIKNDDCGGGDWKC